MKIRVKKSTYRPSLDSLSRLLHSLKHVRLVDRDEVYKEEEEEEEIHPHYFLDQVSWG